MAKLLSKRSKLGRWFTMTPADVKEKFLSLPGAESVGKGLNSFVFVPGTRDDRVLLVAHCDTVWDEDGIIRPGYHSGRFFGLDYHMGLGADDRAGCAILWHLRNMGHSLLIPDGEESGCIGSKFLMSHDKWSDTIAQHQFAIQFDRESSSDLVYYHNASDEFEKWMPEQMPGYKNSYGSFTDICQLCEEISGVNISVGYYNQHQTEELLIQSQWCRTLDMVKNLVSRKTLPRFPLTKKPIPYFGKYAYSGGSAYNEYEIKSKWLEDDDEIEEISDQDFYSFQMEKEMQETGYATCDACGMIMHYPELVNNHYVCPACKEKVL